VIDGHAGNDTLAGQGGDDLLVAGPGADVFAGGPGEDTVDYELSLAAVSVTLDGQANDGQSGEDDNVGPGGDIEDIVGGPGDDTLVGDAAANAFDGGAGNDVLSGASGADILAGGDGADVAAYLERTAPVTATIDGLADSGDASDGPAGARDTIGHDVEILWGGHGDDHLTGDEGPNALYGGDGADVLAGRGGGDAADYSDRSAPVTAALNGQPTSGNAADGPAGARDTLQTDVEAIFGGDGDDDLTGSPSANLLDGAGGNDHINSRDTVADLDTCGEGVDTALVDALDETEACDNVFLPGAEPGPASSLTSAVVGGASLDRAAPTATVRLLGHQSLRGALKHGLVVKVTCSEACSLTARIVLDGRNAKKFGLSRKRKALQIASGRAAVAGRLVVAFNARARRRLASARRLALMLELRATDHSGNTTTLKWPVTLTRTRVSGKPAATPLAGLLDVFARRRAVAAPAGPTAPAAVYRRTMASPPA
jgi:hypothetical protein